MITERDVEAIDEQKKAAHRIDVDSCQTKGCENEPIVDDYGVIVCEAHLTPEIEAYLRRQQNRDAARW